MRIGRKVSYFSPISSKLIHLISLTSEKSVDLIDRESMQKCSSEMALIGAHVVKQNILNKALPATSLFVFPFSWLSSETQR